MTELLLVVKDKLGIHARPAAVIAKTAATFKSKITLELNGKTALANSILQIMFLTAKRDDSVLIRTEGEDEAEAAKAIEEIISSEMPA